MAEKPDMKPGHKEIIGETIAKLMFFEHEIYAYSRFLDTDRIDFLVRVPEDPKYPYKEIQVKYGRIYEEGSQETPIRHTWFPLAKEKLRKADNFFYVFIGGSPGDLFLIIPSKELIRILDKYVRVSKSAKTGKTTYHLDINEFEQGRWGIKKKRNLRRDASLTNADNYLDITEKYLNKFELLKHPSKKVASEGGKRKS